MPSGVVLLFVLADEQSHFSAAREEVLVPRSRMVRYDSSYKGHYHPLLRARTADRLA